MPADPNTCRWCRSQQKLSEDLDGFKFCQNGCAANDDPLYSGYCPDCHREFETGHKANHDQCWECATKQMNTAIASEAFAPKARSWAADMAKKAVGRHVADAKKDVA